ncbi:MAG: DUF1501 domain-containing protein [Gemmatales bacterium]|nr:DUF1501 domain-containing protein [Gemmatales bacterium]MDW8221537.1 DUF1501 domain-containing protein [Gemmatales bacterium]
MAMLHRREAMLRLGQLGLGALTLPQLLRGTAKASFELGGRRGKARSCILIYLWGGPPHQDMFDMKPDAPQGIRSLFKPIATKVPGIQLCEHLPLMAQHTDKMAIIRSLTHPFNDHGQGCYVTLTGKGDPNMVFPRNRRSRKDFPNPAGIVSYFFPARGLPSAVTIPRPIGHDGVIYAGTYAGFLGPRFDPLEVQPPAEVNEAAPHSLDLPQGLSDNDVLLRRGLLHQLEQFQRHLDKHSATASLDAARQQAYDLLVSPRTKRALSLDTEPPWLRDRYGRNEYGECFLLARRLVEAGVRLVTIIWYYVCPDGNVSNVWDNHGSTPSLGNISGYEMLQRFYCLPSLDRAYSALLEDLEQRGLLSETLVAMFGEFGRTPRINNTMGRDHWGPCQSAVLAGGGIRGGQVYGASDKHAAYPVEHSVTPDDLLATIYYALGLAPDSEIHDSQGRPWRITHGQPILALW